MFNCSQIIIYNYNLIFCVTTSNNNHYSIHRNNTFIIFLIYTSLAYTMCNINIDIVNKNSVNRNSYNKKIKINFICHWRKLCQSFFFASMRDNFYNLLSYIILNAVYLKFYLMSTIAGLNDRNIDRNKYSLQIENVLYTIK